MQSIQWYAERLRAMSAAEIVGRARVFGRIQSLRFEHGWRKPTIAAPLSRTTPPNILSLLTKADESQLLTDAEAMLDGRFDLLGIVFEESPTNWHRDPQTDRIAPRSHSLNIDYRRADQVGNVKNIWEKNRHHHLTLLAAAFALTNDERYAKRVASDLRQWLADNQFLIGVNWVSGLEVGLRLISWVWIERFLRTSDSYGDLFGDTGFLWAAIYWHQRFLRATRSHGSSANNHTLGEMAGLYVAASAWPVFAESDDWRREAQSVLERESVAQTFESGLNREQAFAYHNFVLELLLTALLEDGGSQRRNLPVVAECAQRMWRASQILTDCNGNTPRYGDEDDAVVIGLCPHRRQRNGWLARLACFVFGVSEEVNGAEARPRVDESTAFHDAGVYALCSRRRTKDEVFCLVKAGPLGYLSTAAHGHADALSFTVNIGGVPIVVDSGTYVYHFELERRRYFRSTAAHNTITIDGADQADQVGPFLWKHHSQTKLLAWQTTGDNASVSIEHYGYARLPGSPIHRRTVRSCKDAIEIEDAVTGEHQHCLEWRLHFAPSCSIEATDRTCIVRWPQHDVRRQLRIELSPELIWRTERGESNAGWYSSSFNRLEPTATLVGRVTQQLPILLKHVLRIECA